MNWSAMEIDLIEDLDQDTHGIWEVFEFARLHNPTASDAELFKIGRDVIRRWIEEGIVEVAMTPLYPSSVRSNAEILPMLDRVGVSALRYFDNAPSIDITAKASAERPWVAGAR